MDVAAILAMPTIQAVIKSIEENCPDKKSHSDYYDFLKRENLCEVNKGGETKTVLLRNDWDFVVKIPNYAHYPNRNYCALEAENYSKALAYRVEKVLLETAFLCILENGIQLYVQPRYTCDQSDFCDSRANRKALERKLNNYNRGHCVGGTKKAREGMYDSWQIEEKWFARVVQLYGKKFARSLEQWTYDNRVGDLHNCNVGWINSKPIILDYAGYFGR